MKLNPSRKNEYGVVSACRGYSGVTMNRVLDDHDDDEKNKVKLS